jgi:hypothetical protein
LYFVTVFAFIVKQHRVFVRRFSRLNIRISNTKDKGLGAFAVPYPEPQDQRGAAYGVST